MKHVLIIILITIFLATPVNAVDIQAPEVPESGKDFMPNEPETFSEGLWEIIKEGMALIKPSAAKAAGVCFSMVICVVLCSIMKSFPGSPSKVVELVGSVFIGFTLLQPSNTLIHLGTTTITELSDYGKLLFPVLTAALAANGGVTKSTALYTATVAFHSVLCTAISSLIVPIVYIYLCLCVESCAIGEKNLDKIKGNIKWLITWGLKTVLAAFSSFLGITGVVTGTADATAVKAAKMTISNVVPVVGGILSNASETVLVSAGIVKNAAGIYGLLAVMSIWIGPFIKIGIQYLLLKLTNAICEIFSKDTCCKLIQDFASAMGLLLAMTGTVCLFLLISIVCFMKGVA